MSVTTSSVKSKKLFESDNEGRYIRSPLDDIAWRNVYNSTEQTQLEDIIEELDIPEEYVAELEEWVDGQIKQGTKEFIRRFTNILAKSLHGFCVLRALGYHVQLEHNGKQVKSLRQIADHFKCSHQLVHQLTKDFQKQLQTQGIKTNEIEKRTYSMNVVPPKGHITLGNAIKQSGMTRKAFLKWCEQKNIVIQDYKRNSKIIKVSTIPT